MYRDNFDYSIHSEHEASKMPILVDVQYRTYFEKNNEYPEIVLYTREDTGRNRYFIKNFLPYFYIQTTQENLEKIIQMNSVVKDWIIDFKGKERIDYNTGKVIRILKITGKQPWKVPTMRNIFSQYGVSYYEADIPFTHRFMIDNDLNGLQALSISKNKIKVLEQNYIPTICSFDIEIDSSSEDNFDEIMASASRRVTAIGFAWGSEDDEIGSIKTQTFVLAQDKDKNEIKLIEEAFDYLWNKIDPDIIITYNGDKFDFKYITDRMKNLGLSLNIISKYGEEPYPPAFGNGWQIPGVMVYDLFKRTKWMYTPDGRKTLSSVAQEKLKIDKIEITQDHQELWKKSLIEDTAKVLFTNYLRRDVELTYKLWFAMDMNQWLEVIKISGGPPGDAIYFTERQAGEFLVFKTMFKYNIMIPPAPSSEEKKSRKRDRINAMGGLVLDPIRDLTTSVLICDFASMYPSIIVAHNIGGESFKGLNETLLNRFKEEPRTSMAIMQKSLLEKRFHVKELLNQQVSSEELNRLKAYSWGLKIVANSTFGSYNFIGSRFYDTKLAGTITEIGRNYLTDISRKVEEFGKGYKTVYGDTDSVFIETPLDKEVEKLWENQYSNPFEINEIKDLLTFLHQNLPDEMKLELEDVAYRILFHKGAKKRYAYVSAITNDIKIAGFEAIRNDFSPFAKLIQKFSFDILLRSGDFSYSKREIISYIKTLLELPEEELKEKFTTFGPIRRNPKKYKSLTPAIAAYYHYKKYNRHIDWEDFDFFPFIITKGNSAQKDRAKHPELVVFDEIDIDHYIEEALRSINRFNLNISLDEAKGIEYKDLSEYFE